MLFRGKPRKKNGAVEIDRPGGVLPLHVMGAFRVRTPLKRPKRADQEGSGVLPGGGVAGWAGASVDGSAGRGVARPRFIISSALVGS